MLFVVIEGMNRFTQRKDMSFEDITSQKMLNQELINSKEKTEKLEKIKTEFLAQMSHEIRTPLNVLLTFASLMKDELADKNMVTNNLEEMFLKMEIAGKRIIRTIELILNSADVQSGTYLNTPTKTDIYTEVLEKLFSYFQPYAREKKLQFVMIKNTVNTIATVDAYSVEQVFDNLIDNAIKFTDSGKIVIETNTNQEENLIVSIEDTGVGISDEYMNSLFSFFSQEDQSYTRSYEGNGLGLALTKRLCDLNKIKLDLETQKGIGTKFKLTFPNDK